MRTQRVTPNDSLHGESCRDCHRAVRPGQVVAHCSMQDAPGYRRLFVVHLSCLKALVASAPVEDYEVEFETLRSDMIRSGKAFPYD